MQNKIESIQISDAKFQLLLENELQILAYYDTPATTTNSQQTQELPAVELANESENCTSAEEPVERTILSCSYCKIEFLNVAQQREHYKLDWHRYNLKQHLSGQPEISEYEFENKNDDVSSISGSESDSDENSETANTKITYLAQNQGRIYLKTNIGPILLLYRCLLAEKKQEIADVKLSLSKLTSKWAVLMLGGGHFAGAIFDGPSAILHKTFHCYTVRAGQGGSQSARDNKNATSAPKSAGASLRRYNEQALVQHVAGILDTWKDELEKCSIIAFRAPGPYNKNVLFSGKTPVLARNDTRLRVIPFPTRRATFKEVKRVHELLSTVIVYASIDCIPTENADDLQRKRSKTKAASGNRARSRESVDRPLPCATSVSSGSGEDDRDEIVPNSGDMQPEDVTFEMEDLEVSFDEVLEPFANFLSAEERRFGQPKPTRNKRTQTHLARQAKIKEEKLKTKQETQFKHELSRAILTNNFEEFLALLKANPEFLNLPLDIANNTALHLVSELQRPEYLMHLLGLQADLCVKNVRNQTPYTITQDKGIREVFKKFAQDNPELFNYNKAQIPLSEQLTPEQLEERKARAQQQKKAKREKEKEKKKVKVVEKKEQEEMDRFAHLSDREKRALAAERRILNAKGTVIARCFLCGGDMSGRVPFEYSGNRFCTIDCLKAHRMQNPVTLS